MKHNRYKTLALSALLLFSQQVWAQLPRVPKPPAMETHTMEELNKGMKELDLEMKELNLKMKALNQKMKSIHHEEKLASLESIRSLESRQRTSALAMSRSFSYADQDQNYQSVERSKTITKTYKVDAKDKLAINNQYGKVVINVWPKNEIKVDIEIKAFDGSATEAQQLLEGVNIDETRSSDLINFVTNITRKPGGTWWGTKKENGKEERRGIWVDYVVYMPGRNPLDITNKYGSTILPDFDGPVNISNSYGSFQAKELHHAANVVNVRYGSASIGKFSSGTLNVAYGSLKLDNANKLNAVISHGSSKIGKITLGGDIESKYGSLNIGEIDQSVKMLMIKTNYGSATIGIDPAASFEFDVTTHMGGFNYPSDKVKILEKTPEDPAPGKRHHGHPQFTKNYKGNFGKSSDSKVTIKTNYGSVKFQ